MTSIVPPGGLPGTIASGSNVLTLTNATPGLVPGMAVAAAGLPAGAVILSVGTDNKTITLSVAATTTLTGVTFNFAAPAALGDRGLRRQADAARHSQLLERLGQRSGHRPRLCPDGLRLARLAWSVSVHSTPGADPGWIQLLTNIIGGNLNTLYLPNANVNVVNTLTDMSKSALRGVPDLRARSTSDPARWYPDPSLPAGGLTYNAFNLDPYVWFVHDKLGLTAYGFALDDDIGNVNAGGATGIAFAVGGLTGLSNTDPFTNVSPFGVVHATASNTTKLSSHVSGLTGPQPVGTGVVAQVQAYDYNHATPGTLINGPGVAPGTTIQFTNLTPNLTGSSIDLSNPLSTSFTSPSYSFFGTLVFQALIPARTSPTTRSSSTRRPLPRWRSSARSGTSRSTARASTRRTRSRSSGRPRRTPTARPRSRSPATSTRSWSRSGTATTATGSASRRPASSTTPASSGAT